MQFDDEEIREFADIWRDEFNEQLTLAEARSKASRLVEFFATLRRAERRDENSAAIETTQA
jgi:hypothetical protein